MSSMPFQLGIQVVDFIPTKSGSYVLRAKDKESAMLEIGRIRKILTKKDIIKTYMIGMRPDYPIPIGRYFIEVCIEISGADDWMNSLPLVCLYNSVTTGIADGE